MHGEKSVQSVDKQIPTLQDENIPVETARIANSRDTIQHKEIVFQPQTKPAHKKPVTLLSIQAQTDTPVGELLERMYRQGNKTKKEIAELLDVSDITIANWFKKFGITSRSRDENQRLYVQQHPENESQRKAAIRNAWAERKSEIVTKIHKGDSDRKRSESQKARFTTDPDAGNNLRRSKEFLQKARQTYQQSIDLRLHSQFGDNVKESLYQMHHVEGLTLQEIEEKTGYKQNTLRWIFIKNEVPVFERTKQQTVNKFVKVQKLLWANPGVLKTLTEREKYVITHRFIGDGVIPSHEDIALELGVTRQAIWDLETTAIRKLKQTNRS